MFLAVFASILFYGLIYLVIRGTISTSNGIRVNLSSEERKRSLGMNGTDPQYQAFVLTVARSLLLCVTPNYRHASIDPRILSPLRYPIGPCNHLHSPYHLPNCLLAFIVFNIADMVIDLSEVAQNKALPFGLHVFGDSTLAMLGKRYTPVRLASTHPVL